MTSPSLRWSVVAPQGANLELAGMSGARAWQFLHKTADLARACGYDDLWLLDRMDTLPRRELEPVIDGWTALGALAATLPSMGLGILASTPPFRNAAVLAKQAACVDIISDGRLILGFPAAEQIPEHESMGLFPAPADTLDRGHGTAEWREAVGETIEAVRVLWSGTRATFHGRHVHLSAAHCIPAPVQARIPLVIRTDAHGDNDHVDVELLPDAAVRECAVVQWTGEPEEVQRAIQAFRRRREVLGFDPNSVRHAVSAECRLFDSQEDRDRWFATPYVVLFWSHHPDLLARRNLYGTVEQVAKRARTYVAAGVEEFVLWFRDYPRTASLERLAEEVIPHVFARKAVTP
jgi:alkanesulfonate monooxygenase SsuD/methylene tetrahydromethanopterin reductase-like flavin-dependent oxidoreductase (luciferase family)